MGDGYISRHLSIIGRFFFLLSKIIFNQSYCLSLSYDINFLDNIILSQN